MQQQQQQANPNQPQGPQGAAAAQPAIAVPPLQTVQAPAGAQAEANPVVLGDIEALGQAAGLSIHDINLLHDLCETDIHEYTPTDVSSLRMIMNPEDYHLFEDLTNQLAEVEQEFSGIAEIFREEYQPENNLTPEERTNQRRVQDNLITLKRRIDGLEGRRQDLVIRSQDRIRLMVEGMGSVTTETSSAGSRRSREEAGLQGQEYEAERSVRRRQEIEPIRNVHRRRAADPLRRSVGDFSLSTRGSSRAQRGRSPSPSLMMY